MPRPHKCRRIVSEFPGLDFGPRGVPARELETLVVTHDELEALRLADLEGLYQEDAAARMGVSRATFARIVAAARGKVADALINLKALAVEGGVYVVARGRGRCRYWPGGRGAWGRV